MLNGILNLVDILVEARWGQLSMRSHRRLVLGVLNRAMSRQRSAKMSPARVALRQKRLRY